MHIYEGTPSRLIPLPLFPVLLFQSRKMAAPSWSWSSHSKTKDRRSSSLWGNEQTNKQTNRFILISWTEHPLLLIIIFTCILKFQQTLWLFTFTLNFNLECFRFEKIFIHVFIYTIHTCIWNVIQAWIVRITARILCFIHVMIVNNCVFQIILPFEDRSQASNMAHDFSSPLFHIPPSPPPSSQEFD